MANLTNAARCCCQFSVRSISHRAIRLPPAALCSLSLSRSPPTTHPPRWISPHYQSYATAVPNAPTVLDSAPPPPSTPPPPNKRPDRNVIALALFICTGVGLFVYFKNEKIKVEEKKRQERANKSVGKVKIGGPFELVNAKDGKPFTEKDLLGKFSLIYFGFTNCPDICPEELDKMCDVIRRIADEKIPIEIQPVFVSVDPNRDTREAIVKYLDDFDSRMIGLTGDYEAIKKMCKVYRVYFSTPPNLKPTDDYLVDHSIFFYLMAPNGNFVDAFGKIFSKDEVYTKVKSYMSEWSKGKRFGEEEII